MFSVNPSSRGKFYYFVMDGTSTLRTAGGGVAGTVLAMQPSSPGALAFTPCGMTM